MLCLLAIALAVAGDWRALRAQTQPGDSGQEATPGAGRPDNPQGQGRGMRRQGPDGRGGGPIARRRAQREQMRQLRILDRLSRMSPEKRERLLENLPPARRRIVNRTLERYQAMPPERRAALVERLRQFDAMTPERQAHLRELLRSLEQLPAERRQEIRSEFARIQRMPDEERLDYTASNAFRQKFSDSERELLLDLVDAAPAP